MEIITFVMRERDGWRRPRVGALLNNEYLLDFERTFEGVERNVNHMAWLDMDGPWFQKSRDTYESLAHNSSTLAQAFDKGWLTKRTEAYWCAPAPRPGKLICIGLNYRDHAAESNMAIPEKPVVFSKFATAVIAPGEAVILPATSKQVDYEAELAVVIGRRAKHVSANRALGYVLGYTCFNDVSARDFQFADDVYRSDRRAQWLAKLSEPGVKQRAGVSNRTMVGSLV